MKKIDARIFIFSALFYVTSNLFADSLRKIPTVSRHKNMILSSAQDALSTTIDAQQEAVKYNATADETLTESQIFKNNVPQWPKPELDAPSKQSETKEEIIQEVLEIIEQEEEKLDTVELNFENTSLDQFIQYMSSVFGYTFIPPETIEPIPANEKKVKGNLITFKTNKALTKDETWLLFVTFLDMADFTIVPEPNLEKTYRIMSIKPALRAPLPTYIGTNINDIPQQIINSDQLIRYVYFLEHITVDSLVGGPGRPQLLDQIKSPQSELIGLKEHNAILFIDKAYNIANVMQIVKELDKVTVPQSISVLKLRKADAKEVRKLYETLIKQEEAGTTRNLFQRKQPSSLYFPENITVIDEPRSNSLILLGPIEAIKKIENFIIEYVDVEIDRPFSPLFVYHVKYASAETIARIMNDVTKYGGATGSLKGEDKFFKPMQFTAEKNTNRIVVKGDYEDYQKALEIIKQLDEPQPQVAVEVLLLSLNVQELKILGTQMRTKVPSGTNGIFGNNIAYQTSGIFTGSGNLASGIVTNPPSSTPEAVNPPGIQRLLGDLINLASTAGAGNTIVSLGDAIGAWALIQALESLNSTQILSNPFILATNNSPAQVSVGITQRVVSAIVIPAGSDSTSTFKDEEANLTVDVQPLINSDGMITLDLKVRLENFIGQFDPNFVQKSSRYLETTTVVADKEVIALGGLIENTTSDQQSKVPILGDIPLLGWLFKNRNKNQNKNDLLILVATQIVRPEPAGMNEFTQRHINNYEGLMSGLYTVAERRDPIHRFFFEDKKRDSGALFDDFIFDRHHQKRATAKRRSNKRRPMRRSNDEGIQTNQGATR